MLISPWAYHPGVQFDQSFLAESNEKAFQFPVERTVVVPVTKTLTCRLGPKSVPPDRARQRPSTSKGFRGVPDDPHHVGDSFLLGRIQILDQLPRCVGEFVTLRHLRLPPIMATILPPPTFRTKFNATENFLFSPISYFKASARHLHRWRIRVFHLSRV